MTLETLKQLIIDAGWTWRPGKTIPYGTQLIVTDGRVEATVNHYPKRNRIVVGGQQSSLRTTLEHRLAAPSATAEPVDKLIASHIGMDESGKGDWFGPLVVAAVYVSESDIDALLQQGVRDSKLVERQAMPRLARSIEARIPQTQRHVLCLMPKDYNRRYAECGNLNILLADIYAEAAQRVWQATRATQIVCDQFAQRLDRLEMSFRVAGLPRPVQRVRAEQWSIAVAAASVLASARFALEMDRLGSRAGLGAALPRGAFEQAELERVAHVIMRQSGTAGLAHYAKLHFKPIQALMNPKE